MATYVIGDIQGCFDELQQLLSLINFSNTDRLLFAGDLVNRGPKSLQTLRFIKDLGERADSVLGNHDLHLLAVHYGVVSGKRHDTLHEILNAPDRQELMDWLRQRPLFIYAPEQQFALSHAGLPPCWSAKKAAKYAQEVADVISGENAIEYFQHMYGNQPDCWSGEHSGWPRLRLITNYLTRMRFCTPCGKLDFSAKGTLASQPEGYLPWFQLPLKNQADQNLRILFGHWAALEGKTDSQQILALDTGCVWGGRLTALRLEDGQLFSTPAINAEQTPPPTQHYVKEGKDERT